jgi:hypothetical protein
MFLCRHKRTSWFQLVRFYSTKKSAHEVESAVLALNTHSRINGHVSLNQFTDLVSKVAASPYELLNSHKNTSLSLLNACGPKFIDLFPHQRQVHLNRLFHELILPHLSPPNLTDKHFEIYMRNTVSNWSVFDPFELTRRLSEANLKANLSINKSLLTVLCNMNRVDIATAHLNRLLEANSFSKFDVSESKDAASVVSLEHLAQGKSEFDLRFIELFNPLMAFYANRDGNTQQVELLHVIERVGLQPNSGTYAAIVNAYLDLSPSRRFEEAAKLYEKTKAKLDFGDTLSLLTNLITRQKGKVYHLI